MYFRYNHGDSNMKDIHEAIEQILSLGAARRGRQRGEDLREEKSARKSRFHRGAFHRFDGTHPTTPQRPAARYGRTGKR